MTWWSERSLAKVLSGGGEFTSPQLVSEQYLLDLEREAFLSLCGQKKTVERIQFMLKKGKAAEELEERVTSDK